MPKKPKYSDIPKPMDPGEAPSPLPVKRRREVIIIGGGIAGLSAAIYLARALRDVLIVDAGESLAQWEPEVQNYLGFPECIDGCELLRRGRQQAERYGAEFLKEEVERISCEDGLFQVKAKRCEFTGQRLLLATGVYHLPPKIPAVDHCVGKSMFFCKDCDGFRVQGQRVVIVGHNNEAAEYALGILMFTQAVGLLTNGEVPRWDNQHEKWLREYKVPVHIERILQVSHENGHLEGLTLENGHRLPVDSLFTTRGDVYHNDLARQLGVALDEEGQIRVDGEQRTNVTGVYAAGCVTTANCQMIIAAGDGATAAQAINRDLFMDSLSRGDFGHRSKPSAPAAFEERGTSPSPVKNSKV